MKILITGAQGQLGTELRHLLDSRDIAYRGTDAHDLDITDEKAVDQYFKDYQPDLIYTVLPIQPWTRLKMKARR